ncbi:endonuclease domain-containing protein [Gryllotalpicola reticulitermitis]|uniref:Endonuclease domain-containing protein n=1 Tax=Gryllotalpicola reticulitermitis TaxID=1184153 RepID=A0ABV8Q5T8_9MICO
MDIRPLLDPDYGFATRQQLRHHGVSSGELKRQLERGVLVPIGRLLVARADAHPLFLHAVRMGARIACISAAKRRGLWTMSDARLHITPRVLNSHFRADAGRLPVRVHWTKHPIDPAGDRIPIESSRSMLMHVAQCQPLELAVVTFDSALNQGHISTEELRTLASVHGAALGRVLPHVSRLADSGLESLTRVRLRHAGIPCKEQVRIHGHRVDLMVGERLVIQLDGVQHLKDPKQLVMDREYDRLLRRMGYTVLRFSYADVVHHWDRTFGEITALLAQRAHLWP